MKNEIGKRKLRSLYITFQTGYCNVQEIFLGVEPKYYNAGDYGWNWDCYVDNKRNIAITTGYRNTTGKHIPYSLCDKYRNKAMEIISEFRWQDRCLEELKKNRELFLDELLTLCYHTN